MPGVRRHALHLAEDDKPRWRNGSQIQSEDNAFKDVCVPYVLGAVTISQRKVVVKAHNGGVTASGAKIQEAAMVCWMSVEG